MMKKIFTILAILSCAAIAMPAEHQLGYCSGELSTIGAVSVEGKAWVSGAIYLPPSMLAPYEGGKIIGLRAGLASKLNVDTLRLWVRTSLDGENLVEQTVTKKTDPKLAKGWNDVTLPTPYDLDADTGIYVGYSYHQKGATGAFSVVGSQMDNAFYAQLGTDAEWQDLSNTGILSVEAIVDAEMSIGYDLAILSAQANPDSDPAYNRVSVAVRNNGSLDIEGFTLTTMYENLTEPYVTKFDNCLVPGAKTTVVYRIPVEDIDKCGQIVVNVKEVGGHPDEIEGNNTVKARFTILKKVLIEEFTTESCGNCPRVAAQLHTVLGMDEYKDRAFAVCHHSGYYTDIYTLPVDEEYAGFFKIPGAPYMMFNRYPLFDSGMTVAISPDMEDMVSSINMILGQDANLTVGMTAVYDETTSRLTVRVSGEKTRSVGSDERLMVYLVENNVKTSDKGQSGASGDYLHQHVIRAYNGTWGEPVEWNANLYDMEVSFDVDPSWKKHDMQIISAVGNYDDVNHLNCAIDNSEQIDFPDMSGVGAVDMESESVRVVYYTVDGMPAGTQLPTGAGLYIERSVMTDGTVCSRKIAIK